MVLDKMKDILVEQLECNPEDITMESLLVDDLGADSLDAIDIVMSVEDTFKVEVPDEIIEKISIPLLKPGTSFTTYKLSKRFDQDISTVIGAFRLAPSAH